MKFLKDVHWPLACVAFALALIGLIAIYSASFRMASGVTGKQAIWVLVSLGAFVIPTWLGYRSFLNISYVFYGFTLALLGFVLVFGESHLGASRWISIGPFVLQPSEIAKITTILALAHFLSERMVQSQQKRTLAIALLLTAIPMLLILKQPDLGSSLVFLPILIAMVFLWGIRFRYLAVLFVTGFASIPVLWHFLKPYQQRRLLVFFDPSIDPIGASYTAIQSKIAVGSGGLFGKGWLGGTQTHLDFVPEHHTDFIFSVIGEEFGFVGALLIIFLFASLILYIFDIMERTTDIRARLLALGVATFLFFQTFVNIGMTIGLAPITGLTLPLVSYGGSSLVTTFFALGLLASIYKSRSIF